VDVSTRLEESEYFCVGHPGFGVEARSQNCVFVVVIFIGVSMCVSDEETTHGGIGKGVSIAYSGDLRGLF